MGKRREGGGGDPAFRKESIRARGIPVFHFLGRAILFKKCRSSLGFTLVCARVGGVGAATRRHIARGKKTRKRFGQAVALLSMWAEYGRLNERPSGLS